MKFILFKKKFVKQIILKLILIININWKLEFTRN